MLPHYDTYAVMLNLRPAERDAFVDAIGGRRPGAADRPAVTVRLPLRRLLDAMRPLRWVTRLARS